MKPRELFDCASRRARRIRGGVVGGWILLAASAASAIYVALTRFAFSSTLSVLETALLAGIPVVLSAGVAVAVSYGKVDLTRILLAMDCRLGLEARLSSLYEIETRAPVSFLRHRLEQQTAPRFPEWRRGLPIPKRLFAAVAAGFILLAGVAVVGALSGGTPSDGRATGAHQDSALSPDAGSDGVTSTGSEDPAAGTPDELAGEAPQSGLERVLSELGLDTHGLPGMDTAGGAIDVGDDPALQRTLEEWVGELRQRFGQGEGILTQAEQAALLAAAATESPVVQRALQDVLEAGSRPEAESALGRMADALRIAESPAAAEEQGTRVPTDTEDEDDGEEGEVGAPLALPDIDTAGGIGSPSSGDEGAAAAISAQLEDPSAELDFGQEDLGALSSPGLTLEEVPATVSDAGDVRTYLTLGVPIEFDVEGAEGGSVNIDFDRIDSILESRSLSGDATDIVRKYFESITEGGT